MDLIYLKLMQCVTICIIYVVIFVEKRTLVIRIWWTEPIPFTYIGIWWNYHAAFFILPKRYDAIRIIL